MSKHAIRDNEVQPEAIEELESGVKAALETYSNVHRGSGHYSLITTELYEKSRDIVLEHLGLDKTKYIVIYLSPWQAGIFIAQLEPGNYILLSSHELGLSIGLRVLAVKKSALPKNVPFQTGGSVAKIVFSDSVVWADSPQKFEAGTPSIINAITFAIALRIMQRHGADCFKLQSYAKQSAAEILHEDEFLPYKGVELLEILRKQLIGYSNRVPTAEGDRPFVNLDNAASTPTFFPIWNVVRRVLRQGPEAGSDIIDEVKMILAGFIRASMEKYEVIFTSNTTEALNIAARFVQNEYDDGAETVILNTMMEHNSNELPWRYIPGACLMRLPVDKEGFVDLCELEQVLIKYNGEGSDGKKRIRIVAVSGASNVLGTFNDIEAISSIVHKYDARLLVDGAQLAAHRNVYSDKMDIDYLTLSGHKMYAPFGSGALVVKKKYVNIDDPEMKSIIASGEENIAGIAALGKAIALLQRIGMDVIEESENELVNRLLSGLSTINGIEIFGIKEPNSERIFQRGGVISFSLKTIAHNKAAKELAEQGGIGVRNGCFCTHLLVSNLLDIKPLSSLAAKAGFLIFPRLTRAFLPGLVRVSLGLENNEEDVDKLIKILSKIADTPTSIINRLLAKNRNGTPFLSNNPIREQMNSYLNSRVQLVFLSNKDQKQQSADAFQGY